MPLRDHQCLFICEDDCPILESDSVALDEFLRVAIEDLEKELRRRSTHFRLTPFESVDESEDFTFPAKKVCDWLRKELSEARDQGEVKRFDIRPKIDAGDPDSHPILRVSCISTFSFDLERILEEKLEFYGWYIGFRKETSRELPSGAIVFQQEFLIEPNFPVQNDRVDSFTKPVVAGAPNGIFFHVAFEKYAKKIEREGLVPNTTDRDLFRYPNRVYLFNNQDFAIRYAKSHVAGNLKAHTISVNKRRVGKSRAEAEPKYQVPSAGVVLYAVDLKKMLSDGKLLRLHHDNRFGVPGVAFFTSNCIPSKYLTRGGAFGITDD